MSRLEIPSYEFLNQEKTKEMLDVFKGERTGWVLVGPKKWCLPQKYTEEIQHYKNFQVRSDDTWIVTHPRSGTTWTMELVWLLSNNLDFETAKNTNLSKRVRFLENSVLAHPEVMREFLESNKDDREKETICAKMTLPVYESLASTPSPRFIKSHFSFSLLPTGILESGCKIVYVARNPKDVAVSWYHLSESLKTIGFTGDFTTFWHYFQSNLTFWGPYWEHLKEAWERKDHPNLLFIFYEEMIHDYPKAIRKVADFLGKNYSDEQIKKVAEYLSFKNFRENSRVNANELNGTGLITHDTFIRRGKTDGWKDYFTPELNAKANVWIQENLKGMNFSFSILQLHVVNCD